MSKQCSPDTLSVETSSIPWHDGVDFFTKRWTPKSPSPPLACIIFLHGLAEHVERYNHVWPLFAARGFEIYGYDMRGFGKTGPRYGDATLEQHIADLEFAIRRGRQSLDERYVGTNVPIYLYGHSMGAGVVLSLLTRPRNSVAESSKGADTMISGVICGAPWILRTNPPSSLVLWLVPKLAWIYPNMSFKKTLSPHNLTSDTEVAERIGSDPLFRGDMFIKTVSGLLLEGYRVLDEGHNNWPADLPILITHGEKDPSTSSDASRTFIDRLQVSDKEFKQWPGMLHEGHNERPELRDPFLEYSIKWLEKRNQQ